MGYAKLAATDPLTNIPNRRYFLEFAEADMERSLRFGAPSFLLLIDIDHFKNVNDTYGHAAGDKVLRRVAKVCSNSVRGRDLCARLGGEVACILTEMDEWGAVMAAGRLRGAVEQLSIRSGSDRILVRVSIGISSVKKGDCSVDDVLQRADRALYRAKGEGRNCVRCLEESLIDLPQAASRYFSTPEA